MTKEIDLENIGTYIKALHCQIRWVLIDILRDGPKSSMEIYEHLKNVSENIENNNQCHGMCGKGDFKNLQKPKLYYHLRELESVGIIKSDYKPSESKRAPEKVWKLNMEKLTINLK
ncbi:MAG: hypothetical protein KGD74_10650 [Candidatus Lokiarchaeota archaeon]|nr:hypothetical protein [Candidatus Lokiarchaeota archaeon]